jgi:hypothetical protein
MESGNQGQDNHYKCECNKRQCCYKKQNKRRPSVLGERTKEE